MAAFLLALLAFPAGGNWLAALSVRSMAQNSIQLLVIVILAFALNQPQLRPFPILKPSKGGLIGLILAALGYLLGSILSVKALLWGSFLLLAAFLFWTLFGFRSFYTWLGVFIFAFFLLPEIPSDLKVGVSLPLQLLSTKLTTALAGLFIPITSSGNIFYINDAAFEVTVACSGLNTWIGFMFAGLLWMLFERFSLKSLIAVLLGAPVLALVTNSLRLFITALVAYYQSPDAGQAIHTNLEFLLFPAGLLLMWFIARRLHAQG